MRKSALMTTDVQTARHAGRVLEGAGYACAAYRSASSLMRAARRTHHDAVLIEVDAAGDWRAVVQRRDDWLDAGVPMLLVGAPGRGAEALLAGADDFVSRPIDGAELVARLQAATRRRGDKVAAAAPLQHAGCALDERTRSLTSSRARVALTPRELAVARMLFAQAGQRVSRRHLSLGVWGCDEDISARSMEQHMYQLRRKLRRCAGDALALRSVYGGGYRLDVMHGPRADPGAAA